MLCMFRRGSSSALQYFVDYRCLNLGLDWSLPCLRNGNSHTAFDYRGCLPHTLHTDWLLCMNRVHNDHRRYQWCCFSVVVCCRILNMVLVASDSLYFFGWPAKSQVEDHPADWDHSNHLHHGSHLLQNQGSSSFSSRIGYPIPYH